MVFELNVSGINLSVKTDFTEFKELDLDKVLSFSDDPNDMVAKSVFANLWTAQAGMIKAQSESEAANAKLDFECVRAERKEAIRLEHGVNKKDGDKMTESRLKDLVEKDSVTIASERKYIEATRKSETISAVYWAFQAMARRVDGTFLGQQSISVTQDKVQRSYSKF